MAASAEFTRSCWIDWDVDKSGFFHSPPCAIAGGISFTSQDGLRLVDARPIGKASIVPFSGSRRISMCSPKAVFTASFLWHMSCIILRVAKKYQTQVVANRAPNDSRANVRPALHTSGIIGIPPRAKKIQVPRRRLPIFCVDEPAQSVKIRHTSQNLGSPATVSQPAQSPRI
jgi:hypothetical protein